MSFNIFGAADKNSIKVGYVDPERGYVTGVTRLEANKYAALNPGVRFIVTNREKTRFLNINEVNALEPADLIPKGNPSNADGCRRINGLRPGEVTPRDLPAKVCITGGSGIGAVGNPIFGRDGALLAINLVRGGFGYTTPPRVKICDDTRQGSGAVIRSVLGELADTVEVFDQEDDFEIYDLSGDELPGYGDRFGPDGQNLGKWDPNLFASLSADPVGAEIQKYQDYLKEADAAGGGVPFGGPGSATNIKCWWTTRKETPEVVVFRDKTSQVKHNVNHPAWDKEFMNRFAVSPIPPSNVPGSDYAGQWCTFEWEENFPYTGEYVFRGMADNISKMYLDNELVIEPRNFKGGPLPKDTKKITIQEGIHRIKIDLLNVPIFEKPKPKPGSGGCPTEIDFKITTDAQFANGIKIPGLDIDVSKRYDGKQLNESFRRKVELGKEYDVICTSNRKSKSSDKDYSITYEDLNDANDSIKVTNNGKKIELKDGHGNDTNVNFEIRSTSPGVSAKFSNDGQDLIVKGKGDVTIRIKYDDNPNYAGEAVRSITIAGTKWRKERKHKGEETKTIKVSGDGNGGGSKPNIRLRTSGANVLQMEEHKDKDWKDLVCTVSCGRFIKIDGNRCKLIFDAPPAPELLQSSNQSQTVSTVFNTVDFINKADRKLWRTNVYGKGGFLGNYGICPFNTRKTLKDNPYAGTHVIRWEHVNFPQDGNYDIDVEVDDRVKLFIGNSSGDGAMKIGNGLRSVEEGGDEVIIEKNGFIGDSSKGTGKSTYTRFFKKGNYRIRAELFQKPGGRFGFNEKVSRDPNKSTANVKFVRRGNENYMKVDGSGSVEIAFRLRTDDNPRTAGDFASKIKIGKGANDSIELKRSRSSGGKLKEKEVITGSAFFEAGREYLVKTFGSSSSTGSRIEANGKRIGYDDNLGNGYDMNGELTITKVKGIQPAPIKGINPMALAIDIKTRVEEQPRISPRTWNENPMGAALCIDAPLPPIPQEQPVDGEGRCPKNPIWTTRFPGSSESWWPVTLDARWSKFMNRFALSPLPPRIEKNTDGGGGKVYSTSWDFEAPYDGFYALKGTCDNWGRVLVDGGDTYEYKLRGFKTVSPPIEKFFLPQGNHKITVEVENQKTLKKKTVKKKVFTTKDWAKRVVSDSGLVDVNFKVTSDAKFANSIIFADEFSFSKEYGGPQIKERISKKLEVGKVYNVRFKSNSKHDGNTKDYSIIYKDLNPTNESIRVVKNGKKIELKDGKGNDANVEFEILSTSPGVTAKFSDDGKELKVKGDGDATIRIKYDDNPGYAGEAVRSITIAGTTWRKERTEYGEETKTIKIKTGDGGERANVKLRTAGETVVQMEDFKDNDYTDIIISASKGKFYDLNGNKCKFVIGVPREQQSTKTQGGVTYSGPELFRFNHKLWSKFMNNINVSPYLPPLNIDNDGLPGDRTFVWSNVNFFDNGSYEIKFQSDDNATLFINGIKVADSKSFRGTPNVTNVNLSAGRYEIRVELNNLRFARNKFINNPTGFALNIEKEVVILRESKPWIENPVGVSAILIPPPCPKRVRGVGIVTDLIVDEPGNYPPQPIPPGGGYPVALVLDGIDPVATGINYDPNDVVCVEKEDGTKVCFPITPGNFGQVNEVRVEPIVIPPTYPVITLDSDTGVGFVPRPRIRPVIVPENILPDEDIIQVTDLVGLKQTGYVNGKPYFGSVFVKDGQLFAGIFETIGELIPVYATLQESIDNQVTTRPSAIFRQGTDVTSNDPRLNIPGTPENLI